MSDFDAAIEALKSAISKAEFDAWFAGRCDLPGVVSITLAQCRDHLQRAIDHVEAAQAANDRNHKEA